MIRKAILGAGGVALLGVLAFGWDALSYCRTGFNSARQAVKSAVPLEVEIERARDMVQHIVPDIRQCMHVIAEEEVNVEQLNVEIDRQDVALAKQKEQILALRSNLDSGKSSFKYAGRTFTSDDVQRDLKHRFDRFKISEDTLASKKQILAAREKSLAAARAKLDTMLKEKQNLEVQVENLDARLKTLRAAEAASHVVIDDSQLARARNLINDLNKQLEVKTRVLEKEGELTGEIPVDAADEVPADLSQQIDDYFHKDATVSPTTAGRDL